MIQTLNNIQNTDFCTIIIVREQYWIFLYRPVWSTISYTSIYNIIYNTIIHSRIYVIIKMTLDHPINESYQCSIQWNLWTKDTLGPSILSFVERFWMYSQHGKMNICGTSFVERIFLLCPLLRGSFIGGSTVHTCLELHVHTYAHILHYTNIRHLSIF